MQATGPVSFWGAFFEFLPAVTITPKIGKIFTSGKQHGTAKHWETIQDIGGDLAKKGDDVYLNKEINTALGVKIDGVGKWKPDIVGVKDKTVNLIEVISPSQTAKQTYKKIDKMANTLQKQGYTVKTKVVTETGGAAVR